MATRQFVGLEGSSGDVQRFEPFQEIPHENRTIICFQAHDKTGPYGIVPGYKASEPYTTAQGTSAIKVDTVPGEEKERIKQTLDGVLQGRIHFWS